MTTAIAETPHLSRGAIAAAQRTSSALLSFSTSTLQAATVPGIDFDENGDLTSYLAIPPDPIAAAGRSHVVMMVNTSIVWATKAGTFRHAEGLAQFFAPLNPVARGLYDPKIVYDQYDNRFVALVLERLQAAGNPSASPDNTSRILLAVSRGGDPSGGWYFQSIDAKEVLGGSDAFADFPGLAVDSQGIYVTHNVWQFEPSEFEGSRLVIVPKDPFYFGMASATHRYDPAAATQTDPMTMQPAHMFGAAPAGVGTFLVGYSGLTNKVIEGLSIIQVDDPLGAPVFTRDVVLLGDIDDVFLDATDTFIDMPHAPQPGTTHLISTEGRDALHAVWQNGHLYATAQVLPPSGVDAGQATAHWFQVAANGTAVPTLEQQGNIGGEDLSVGTYTYFPSIGVDALGDVGIGFSASSPTLYAGAYYTGRRASDVAGTVRASGVVHPGEDYYFRQFNDTRNRWGDFSGLALDPNDDATFWAYNEWAEPRGSIHPDYPDQDGRWGTALASFQYAPGDITVTSLVGDIDDFTPGSFDDISPKSEVVLGAYARIAADPGSGQNFPANLDEDSFDRPVGLTHYFTIADGALITSAHLKLHVKSTDSLFSNDLFILTTEAFPLVTFYDLLGYKYPSAVGTEYVLDVDLGRVPVRTGGDVGPGGDWSTADPAFLTYQDLRPGLLDGQFDMVLGDDHYVDYSQLTIQYALQPNTAAGTAVVVSPSSGVDVTFQSVLLPGHTTVATGLTPAAPLPEDYALGTSAGGPPISVYDIETSAVFEGAATVSVKFDPSLFQHPENVRLLHLEGDRYVDRTTAIDMAQSIVTAEVGSLPEFVVAEFTGVFMSRLGEPDARLQFTKNGRDRFTVTQAFTLGGASHGIDPSVEPVEIGFGFYDQRLPPGSFRRVGSAVGYWSDGRTQIFVYDNPKARGVDSMVIVLFDGRYGFVRYAGRDVDLGTTLAGEHPAALPFMLRIGDDYGTVIGHLRERGHVWAGR